MSVGDVIGTSFFIGAPVLFVLFLVYALLTDEDVRDALLVSLVFIVVSIGVGFVVLKLLGIA
ncbi:hypothetical protein BAGA_19120 [Bacillus gaemokensis]|uniref:Uncharacterized protein n=1 Tax=Bacillus gaemokensis TaxID=574375 RepID=A0A073K7K3_9BACI|nr:hypothetical protein BAGA_19120 [Bacillus gaemokensis]KYG28792.1 hypothetical protein AZF08_13790 [Bacillus gaemokensis]